jgi:hypothetical protein
LRIICCTDAPKEVATLENPDGPKARALWAETTAAAQTIASKPKNRFKMMGFFIDNNFVL